ncbi:MAG: hypothetical protein O9353_09170 [Bacteroidia bacterium]|nr:hypothetical protein [Bacteroidia bacterium]
MKLISTEYLDFEEVKKQHEAGRLIKFPSSLSAIFAVYGIGWVSPSAFVIISVSASMILSYQIRCSDYTGFV